MALHVDAEIERLAMEIAQMTGETETEAVRRLLIDRKRSLEKDEANKQVDELMRWLKEEYWPSLPPEVLGKGFSKEEIDALYE